MDYSFERQKKLLQLLMHFKKTSHDSGPKPNKILVDKSSEFYCE